MTPQAFIFAAAVGAALIALWLNVRFETRAPKAPRWILVHLGGAFALIRILPVAVHLVSEGDSVPRKLVGVFLVMLPGLVYIWLTSIWLIRLAQRATGFRY